MPEYRYPVDTRTPPTLAGMVALMKQIEADHPEVTAVANDPIYPVKLIFDTNRSEVIVSWEDPSLGEERLTHEQAFDHDPSLRRLVGLEHALNWERILDRPDA